MASTSLSMARSETDSVPPTSLAINRTQRPSFIPPHYFQQTVYSDLAQEILRRVNSTGILPIPGFLHSEEFDGAFGLEVFGDPATERFRACRDRCFGVDLDH